MSEKNSDLNQETDVQEIDRTDPSYWQDPLPGENNLWFGRFRRYLLMPQRYLLTCAKLERAEKSAKKGKLISTPKSWEDAFKKFEWKARSQAYDNYIFKEEEAEHRAWKKRFLKQLREDVDQCSKLADEMMSRPLEEAEVARDGQTMLLVPARWTMRDAIAAKATARDLGLTVIEQTEPDVDLIQAVKRLAAEGILEPDLIESAGDGYQALLEYIKQRKKARDVQGVVGDGNSG